MFVVVFFPSVARCDFPPDLTWKIVWTTSQNKGSALHHLLVQGDSEKQNYNLYIVYIT